MSAEYLDEVRRKAERMARARRQRRSLWRHVAHVGSLGFLLVVPAVGGAAVGWVIARDTGFRGAAVIGLLVGVILGGVMVWTQLRRTVEPPEEDEP